jgi:hypothetical protein
VSGHSSVDIATRLRNGRLKNRGLILDRRKKDFCWSQSGDQLRNSLGVMGSSVYFPVAKPPEHEAEGSPLSSGSIMIH